LQPKPYLAATVEIYEHQIPGLLASFSLFLGKEELAHRIEVAEKMLRQAPPVYKEFFVGPKQFLWLGTKELFRLSTEGRLKLKFMSPTAIAALHHVAALRNAIQTMPSWKKNEFRSRLMDKAGGDIPALAEIATASRIVTLGGNVKWIPEKAPGERVFDILASYRGEKFEVECKAKTVDAGRKLARGDFYQFTDRLLKETALVNAPRQNRHVCLITDGRFPASHQEQAALVAALKSVFNNGGSASSTGKTKLTVELISSGELRTRAFAELADSEHRFITNELLVTCRSQKADQMVANIEHDLRDALQQLTGSRPAAIVCYVPEVEAFDGTEKFGTATHALVHRILSLPAARNIFSITLFSDQKIDRRSDQTGTEMPSVRFFAEKFRGSRLAEIF
jgi:hypothetical protein